ncbi:hypothetical protein DICPUDRAFT_157255 [Dictyostelium purpureum]|uniref:Uncharacterized protein n=1 Tax=Dictyostelium purpureum TaxID=5786 RepID=F0ZYN6_DICPU|nr:uncharacterized protein DICPUDRAFT_157255 [Dictyostelium purpureum]EGC30955.1 hypothetical protein DICPUDRAFT_157255 [Dictyostelium purpureum]|eukprot:XP_003292532.1 hypothetical protein DICPUDRAFT_157255 [Dictyostelium purpureum]
MDDSSILFLDEELKKINDRFQSGEMRAFGLNQQKILKDFQEIRKLQAQLSMKQVSIGSERIKVHDIENIGKEDIDINVYDSIKEREEDLTKLTQTLNSICKNIETTNKLASQSIINSNIQSNNNNNNHTNNNNNA